MQANWRLKVVFIALSFYLAACGSNVFDKADKKSVADEAVHYIELGKSEKAIAVLLKGLKKEPENYLFMSLMASAYAQKHGVDLISIAEGVAKDGDSSSSKSGSLKLSGLTCQRRLKIIL